MGTGEWRVRGSFLVRLLAMKASSKKLKGSRLKASVPGEWVLAALNS